MFVKLSGDGKATISETQSVSVVSFDLVYPESTMALLRTKGLTLNFTNKKQTLNSLQSQWNYVVNGFHIYQHITT